MHDESRETPSAPPMQSEYPVAEIGEVLAALADPTRLFIVRSLAESEQDVSCGAFGLPLSKPTLTHHFKTLKFAGLIGSRMEGTRKFIHLRRDAVDAVYPGLLDSVLQSRRPEPAAR